MKSKKASNLMVVMAVIALVAAASAPCGLAGSDRKTMMMLKGGGGHGDDGGRCGSLCKLGSSCDDECSCISYYPYSGYGICLGECCDDKRINA